MNVERILAEAPQRAVYWSPVVNQYFCREYRSFANRSITVDKCYRSELVRLDTIKR